MPTKKQIKEQGVVYTPNWIVENILDLAAYKSGIYDKRVIDPACGDGAFLREVVKRIILDALNQKITKTEISKLLSDNVYGADIDAEALESCKSKLNMICEQYDVPLPTWKNLMVTNSLLGLTKLYGTIAYVFGNPPYVRIQNLDELTRKDINKNYTLCQHGSTDIYIAFYELGVKLLNNSGKLGYITPSTFLKSAAGRQLREFLFDKKITELLVDFEYHQVFDGVITYSLTVKFIYHFYTNSLYPAP